MFVCVCVRACAGCLLAAVHTHGTRAALPSTPLHTRPNNPPAPTPSRARAKKNQLVGVWCLAAGANMGSPRALRLVELGPGRGTLMADLLRGNFKQSE